MFTRRFDTGIIHPRYFAPDDGAGSGSGEGGAAASAGAAGQAAAGAGEGAAAGAASGAAGAGEGAGQNNEANMWRRKAEAAAAKLAELETAETARKQAEMTELERERARADQAETARKQAEDRALRLQIAGETGLPIEVLNDLNGADEATLRAQAGRLAVNVVKPPVQAGTTTRPATGQQPTVDEQITAAQKAGNTSEAIRLKREQAGFGTR